MLTLLSDKTTQALGYVVTTLEQYDADLKQREAVFRQRKEIEVDQTGLKEVS